MIKKIVVISIAATMVSCNSGNTDKTTVIDTSITLAAKDNKNEKVNEAADFKFTTLVINIPSPFDNLSKLAKAAIPYKKDMVNPVENETKYATSTKKGLNFGTYLVDIVYLSLNEQYSDVKKYFITTRNLAKNLGCADSFDKLAGLNIEKNLDNKDSVNHVMDRIYTEMDKFLRSNDQIKSATQMLVGSWIESQYITISVIKDSAKDKTTEDLFNQVAYQNYTSQKLVGLLKEFEKEKEFKPIISGVGELDKIYSGMKNGNDVDKTVLDKLYKKLSEIRGLIVN